MSTHVDLLKRLLPPVSLDPNGKNIGIQLEAEGAMFDRVSAYADLILDEADPRSTSALMPDWERVYGLPDTCAGGDQTSAERRTMLVMRASLQGGLSKPWFIALAARLGYPITIDELHPHHTEDDTEYAATDEQYEFIWRVNAPLTNMIEKRTEDDTEMATALWGNKRLECVFNCYKRPETFIIFSYLE